MKRDRAVVRIPPRPASRQGPRGRAHTTTAGGPFIPPCPCILRFSPFFSLHAPRHLPALLTIGHVTKDPTPTAATPTELHQGGVSFR